jgi:hypothetical protein
LLALCIDLARSSWLGRVVLALAALGEVAPAMPLGKGVLAGEEHVNGHAKRPPVDRLAVALVAVALFGRHEGACTAVLVQRLVAHKRTQTCNESARRRSATRRASAQRRRQPTEISDADVAIGIEHDILGLEICA